MCEQQSGKAWDFWPSRELQEPHGYLQRLKVGGIQTTWMKNEMQNGIQHARWVLQKRPKEGQPHLTRPKGGYEDHSRLLSEEMLPSPDWRISIKKPWGQANTKAYLVTVLESKQGYTG